MTEIIQPESKPTPERRRIPQLSQFKAARADELFRSNAVYCDQLVTDHDGTVRRMKVYLFSRHMTNDEKQTAVDCFNLFHSRLMDQFFDAVATLCGSRTFQLGISTSERLANPTNEDKIQKEIYTITIEGICDELKNRGWNAHIRKVTSSTWHSPDLVIEVEAQLDI